jgi:hypothetical protein
VAFRRDLPYWSWEEAIYLYSLFRLFDLVKSCLILWIGSLLSVLTRLRGFVSWMKTWKMEFGHLWVFFGQSILVSRLFGWDEHLRIWPFSEFNKNLWNFSNRNLKLSHRFYFRILQNLFNLHSLSLYWPKEARCRIIVGIDYDSREEYARIVTLEEVGGNWKALEWGIV